MKLHAARSIENKGFTNETMNNSKFWKSNVKAVPGRPSRHKEDKPSKHHKSTPLATFQDFQEKVSDAWEINEDEILSMSDADGPNGVQQCSNIVSVERENDIDRVPFCDQEKSNVLRPFKQNQLSKNVQVLPQTHNVVSSSIPSATVTSDNNCSGRLARFQMLLNGPQVNLDELRRLSWSGVPPEVRSKVWRLLSGYIPVSLEKQEQVLERKRLDYQNLIDQYYNPTEWDDSQNVTFRQIHIDIPRMSQIITLFQQKTVQEMFERILFIWAIRHPASGYVQGINDLVTPFFVIFLKESLKPNEDVTKVNVSLLPEDTRNALEADSFWCLSKFLDSVQDNYTFAQLGVQRKITRLKELIHRIDGSLHKHLQENGIDYIQFSYRWMNNLLTRELSLNCTIRLWDTYLAEIESFASFHDYICAAFLEHWRKDLLMEKDFQGLMLTLQNLPTKNWTDTEIGILVAEAYKLKYSFDDAPKHLVHVESS